MRNALRFVLMTVVLGVLAVPVLAATWGGSIGSGGGGGGFSLAYLATQFLRLDGTTTMTGAVRVAAASDDILAPSGNMVITAPDGGVTIGPNKATFQAAVKDETERTLVSQGGYAGTTGTSMGGSAITINQFQYTYPVTVTAVVGRQIPGSATSTATIRFVSADGVNDCICTHNCTTSGFFRSACVNDSGTGCSFAAGEQVNVVWAQDGSATLDACSTAAPAWVASTVLGKHQ
jgi:hypothetical protein